MAAIITNNLRIYNAQQFIESLNESASQWQPSTSYVLGDIVFNKTNLYVCVGGSVTTGDEVSGVSSSQTGDPGPAHESGVQSDGTLKWLFYNKSSYNNLYLGIGKVDPWGDAGDVPPGTGGGSELNPPTPKDTITDSFKVLSNLLSLKKIDPRDVTLAIPRINWESGLVYTMYEHDKGEEIVPNYYVVTEDDNQYNVYKCINNTKYIDGEIKEVASTDKPSGHDPDNLFEGSDGYVWKFMYSILLEEALKFLTEDYIPVKHIATDPDGGNPSLNNPGHLQWEVQQAAVDGSIEHISVVNKGSGYEQSNPTGTVVSASGKYMTVSDTTCSPTESIYNGYSVYITGGTGKGQMRRIVKYSGSSIVTIPTGSSSYVLELDTDWDSGNVPDNTSSYIIGPRIIMNDELTTGQDCLALGMLNGGSVVSVNVYNKGKGYTAANAEVSEPNGNNKNNATIKAIISPSGGHGSNPVEELGGYYGMIDMKLIYDENGMIPVIGEHAQFRQISVVVDPIEEESGVSCNTEIYRGPKHPEYKVYTSQDTSAKDDAFIGDETPSNERTIYGTGKLLYIENRQQISRAIDQIEDIKIVFEF